MKVIDLRDLGIGMGTSWGGGAEGLILSVELRKGQGKAVSGWMKG